MINFGTITNLLKNKSTDKIISMGNILLSRWIKQASVDWNWQVAGRLSSHWETMEPGENQSLYF